MKAQHGSAAQELLKPRRLRAGDVVASVSLSSGFACEVPERYRAGKRCLEQVFGLRVVEAPNSQRDEEFLHRNPQARVDDLHWALSDPEVTGIVSNIGGSDSVRLMPMIDFELIRQDPKVFLGYSDTTMQHMAFLRAGVASFYGPSLLTDIAETGGIHAFTEREMRRVLFSTAPAGALDPTPEWTEEFLDWTDPANEGVRRTYEPNPGWVWVQGADQPAATGPLIGGCIETLEKLKPTPWWPEASVWEGAVLYLESSELVPPPSQVEAWLRDYGARGVLQDAAAMLLARPYGYTPEMKGQLFEAVRKVLASVDRPDLPVIADMDFGHTSPIGVLPNGCRVRIDPAARTIDLIEAGVRDE